MMSGCRICANRKNNKTHHAREMMFGSRDEFEYLECGSCGTLQITEIPDLSAYYPQDYYSLNKTEEIEFADKLKKRIAARYAGKYFIKGRSLFGKYVSDNKPWIHHHFPASLKDPILNIDFKSRILDFGCGNGRLLRVLSLFGFRNLTGADAFIESEIAYSNDLKIFKKSLDEIEPFYDLVMLHHSFEHLPNPQESILQAFRLVKPGGFCLVRIPLVNFAWEKYGVSWVQLDPPRHLFLYTETSFRILAEKAGFSVEKVVYDSEEFQFWASEYYSQNIAMSDENWFDGKFENSIFTEEQFLKWQNLAKQLNDENRGDQACFYLRKR
jgi:SAM-dependent methyltransferase